MSSYPNMRYNHEGNVEDEHGGSYYVVSDDRRIAGPFASGAYSTTVRDRLDDEWDDPRIEYEP